MAWLLLLSLCFQRIISFVGQEVVYAVELEERMDGTERLITEKIKQKIGIDTHIDIHDENELELLLKRGYSAPFIFSEEINGHLYYYTIDNTPVKVVDVSFETNQEPANQKPYTANVSSGKQFSDFYFWNLGFLLKRLPTFNSRFVSFQHILEAPYPTVPSPPPKSLALI